MQRFTRFFAVAAVVVAVLGTPAFGQPCEVPDNGTGTVDLPPPGCGYVSPSDFHLLLDGVPPGSQIRIDASHEKFFNVNAFPGGNLGGEVEQFSSILVMEMTGEGALAGFNRTLFMQLNSEAHTGPRTLGDPVQTFPNDMFFQQGEIFGDPDFDVLRIEAGTAFGLPSPGETTLTQLPSGNFNVDSFFDVTYRITFQGAPGSILDGMGGTTEDTVRMSAGEPASNLPPPCVVQDNGTGTVDLPPDGCSYVSPFELHMMIDGLPAGTQINIAPEHRGFFNVNAFPGGNLGGEVEQFDSSLDMVMTGTGALAGFQRTISMPLASEAHTGPRNPGDDVQTFPNDMFFLQGELFGDPDFDFLRIEGGTAFGLPSPGQTTLTRLPTGDFNVDSFFDVTYRITFQGAPGSILDGMAGTTTGSVGMQTGQPPGAGCPPLPGGTDVFPSTGKLVLEMFNQPDPIVVRLSSADLPDTIIQRQPQVGDSADLEITQLFLGGFHPALGGMEVRISPTQPTLGQLTNIVQDPVTCELISADSFFDVIVDIELFNTGQTLSCDRPLHIQRKITRLPPEDEKYENPFVDPVILIDNGNGNPVGQILYHLHHADPPFPPGPDCFDTFMFLNAQIPPLGFFGQLEAFGPTTVDHGPGVASGTCSGGTTACQRDADCPLGEVCVLTSNIMQQQLVEMDLQGFHPQLGPFVVRLGQDLPSQGQSISQNPGHGTFAADSFFDVFFEIELPDQGLILRNPDSNPLPIQAGPNGPSVGVRNIPPDPQTPFQSPPGVQVPLITEDGQPVGDVSNVQHIIDPPRDWAPPPPADEDCFDSWVVLEITIFNPFCTETVMLPGHFRVLRDSPAGAVGAQIIDLLMAKGLFEANSQCVGPLSVRLNPTVPSSGQVSQLATTEFFPADSFFDIEMVADTGIGTLTPGGPSRMTTTINSLPPEDGEIYFGPGTVIPLFDDTGNQIGEILEVEHKVHQLIECPADCRPVIQFLNTTTLDASIPGAGGGVRYDVLRGDLATVATFLNPTVISNNAGPIVTDPTPANAGGFYYIARDRYGTSFRGTWNSGGPSQAGDRDTSLP